MSQPIVSGSPPGAPKDNTSRTGRSGKVCAIVGAATASGNASKPHRDANVLHRHAPRLGAPHPRAHLASCIVDISCFVGTAFTREVTRPAIDIRENARAA